MAKKSTPRARRPSLATKGHLVHPQNSGSGSGSGSGSRQGSGSGRGNGSSGSGSGIQGPRCKFFPKGQLLPVELTLQLDAPLEGGLESGCQQLNRPAILIHAQDPAFACCWFSRPIDLGDERRNPAFWMLQKTAMDTWLLCLRRVSGQISAYRLQSKIKRFPITLKKGRTTKDFKWPPTITISQGG